MTSHSALKQLLQATLFGVLLFLGGLFVIPIGPVPVTLQTLFLFVCACTLSRSYALMAVGLFVLLKVMLGGPAVVMSPTFGYVLAFFSVPFWVGAKSQNVYWRLVAAQLTIYAVGCAYFAMLMGFLGTPMGLLQILFATVLPFIPFDGMKLWLAPTIAKRLRQMH